MQWALRGVWVLYDGVLAQFAEGTLHFRQLPSAIRRIEDREWCVDLEADIKLEEFEISPGMDLLVLVERVREGYVFSR